MKIDVYLKLKDSCLSSQFHKITPTPQFLCSICTYISVGVLPQEKADIWINKMEVKDIKEQKRVSKQIFHKHSPLLTSSFVCVMDVLWDWWCWTQLLSIFSSKWQQKRNLSSQLVWGGFVEDLENIWVECREEEQTGRRVLAHGLPVS